MCMQMTNVCEWKSKWKEKQTRSKQKVVCGGKEHKTNRNAKVREETRFFIKKMSGPYLWTSKIKEKKPLFSCSFWSYPPYGEQK